MKQLDLTDELIRLIKSQVGEDVDLDGIAVFEAITLNTLPLPGKRGSIWEGAIATPLTLQQIAQRINDGQHLPLIADHELSGAPKGRVFHAALSTASTGELEVRTLFYLDKTEAQLIAKLNSGSLDEVSISFLPTQYQCSECDFDYRSDGANFSNFMERTCDQGHTVGEDGVHVRMIGLDTLIEVSLVARGAAAKPKIVGRSASKLAPAPAQRLAASGFEIDDLVCRASRGEEKPMDTKFITELSEAKAGKQVAEAQLSAANTQLEAANTKVTTLTTDLSAREEEITTLKADLESAKGESKADEAELALGMLTDIRNRLAKANGVTAEAPTTAAELKAEIEGFETKLSALIPDAPVAQGTQTNSEDEESKPLRANFNVFRTDR